MDSRKETILACYKTLLQNILPKLLPCPRMLKSKRLSPSARSAWHSLRAGNQ